MDERSESPTGIGIRVAVCGFDSAGRLYHCEAYARDVSRYAARLEGMSRLTRAGETVEVEYRDKARFQVIWVDKQGSEIEEQVGILCLEPHRDIWQVNNLEAQTARQERRKYKRHVCSGTMYLVDQSTGLHSAAQVRDLSLGGCFVLSTNPLPSGKDIEIKLDICGKTIEAKGKVVSNHTKLGMRVQFTRLPAQEATKLLLAVRVISTSAGDA